MPKGKLLIVSAPSGSGKSTLVKYLMEEVAGLEFSVSATNRQLRGNEKHGVDYYFLSTDEFLHKAENKEFVEWEQVYEGRYYGTLKSEVDRIRDKGNTVVFDIDVMGGINMKKIFGDEALAVFIKPPSIDELKTRLIQRDTDSNEEIEQRIGKAAEEMEFAGKFDCEILNDDLLIAKKQLLDIVQDFLT